MEPFELWQGDCLELMKDIPNRSVDMVLCDLPYGITQNKWDKMIALEPLWEQYKRICKENAAILLFSCQPFTTDLISSNRKMYRYEIIWKKTQQTGFFNAKKMPLRIHENIEVFYKKQPTYNPQMWICENGKKGNSRKNSDFKKTNGNSYGKVSKKTAESWEYVDNGMRYPRDVITYSNWNGALFGNKDRHIKHPTAKPVDLLEYLIKTYTNEGETVLDNCMGSGSTGVACVNTGRNFFGIELDHFYFKTAQERIGKALKAREGAGHETH